MIEMFQAMVAGSRGLTGSAWAAWAEVGGERYAARGRHGALHALARVLVAAGVGDQPVEVRSAEVAGVMRYRSLHKMAGYTFKETADRPLHRIRYTLMPEGVPARTGIAQNRGESGVARSWVSLEP